MSDTKDSMPAQPRTKELPAMTDRALLEDLSRTVREGFSELRADVQLVSTDVSVVKERVRLVEERVHAVEERATNGSIRAKHVTENDSKQDAILADHTVRLEAIEKKTDAQTLILTDMKELAAKLSRNPVVVGLLTAAATAATAWFAARGH